jgi:hypothetical protein
MTDIIPGKRFYTLQIYADTGEIFAVTDTPLDLGTAPVAKAGERQVEFVVLTADEFLACYKDLAWKTWNRAARKMEAM